MSKQSKVFRVLFVDDNRLVKAAEDNVELVVARTSEEAQAQLLSGRWDEVWLDHYMDERLFATTRPLAEWMVVHQSELDIGVVLLHTSSPPDAKDLKKILNRLVNVGVYIHPFWQL